MPEQNSNDNKREKEIKLLHLDYLQREVLEPITTKFVNGVKINISEVVEAFTKYTLLLTDLAVLGEKTLCDNEGKLSSGAEDYFKKFTDTILVCSKYFINYNKVFESPEVKKGLIKATTIRSKQANHYRYELEYKIKITTYAMLESDNARIVDYSANMEDFYLRSLVVVNPAAAKRSFIDHIVTMLCYKNNHTMSDVLVAIDKYVKYLGKVAIDHDKIEILIHKYSNASEKIHEGFLHAAKVEIFKVLEGL